MTKTFSAKLDAKVIAELEHFCSKHHLKKSHFLADLIREGLKRRAKAIEFAESIQRGLEQEGRGEFYTADEVETRVFGKKKVK